MKNEPNMHRSSKSPIVRLACTISLRVERKDRQDEVKFSSAMWVTMWRRVVSCSKWRSRHRDEMIRMSWVKWKTLWLDYHFDVQAHFRFVSLNFCGIFGWFNRKFSILMSNLTQRTQPNSSSELNFNWHLECVRLPSHANVTRITFAFCRKIAQAQVSKFSFQLFRQSSGSNFRLFINQVKRELLLENSTKTKVRLASRFSSMEWKTSRQTKRREVVENNDWRNFLSSRFAVVLTCHKNVEMISR